MLTCAHSDDSSSRQGKFLALQKGVVTYKVREFELIPTSFRSPFCIDGDPHDVSRVKVQCLERALNLFVLPVEDHDGAAENAEESKAMQQESKCASLKTNAMDLSLVELFEEVDADGSGAISSDELKAAMSAQGMDAETVEKLFSYADVNKDGIVSREEWEKVTKEHKELGLGLSDDEEGEDEDEDDVDGVGVEVGTGSWGEGGGEGGDGAEAAKQ